MANNETNDKLKGKLNQAAGAVREKTGDTVGNEEMERKGAMQHAKGDAQESSGKVQGAVKDVANKAKDAVGR